jgi:hypothetical protein
MTKEEIIKITKLFNDFRAEYNSEKSENIWKKQSEEFRRFWREKILNDNYTELSETDMDNVIRFFDSKAKGAGKEFEKNGGESAALANIPKPKWHGVFKDLKKEKDIRNIVNQILVTEGDDLKINLINELNEKNTIKYLTGEKAMILNAFLFTYNPDKYLSVLSVEHKLSLVDFFGLGDLNQYKTYGEKIIETNRDIISGFKGKYNINTTPRILSELIYNEQLNKQLKEQLGIQSDKIYPWLNNKIRNKMTNTAKKEKNANINSPTFIDKNGFVLEKYLEDFLIANWESTKLGELYDLIEENGNVISQQYPTKEIGNIDLLVKEKKSGNFVVIELKKGLTSDQTVGQLTRYMGWVKKNKSNGEKVKGIIVTGSQNDRLKYAISATPNMELFVYKINFALKKPKG